MDLCDQSNILLSLIGINSRTKVRVHTCRIPQSTNLPSNRATDLNTKTISSPRSISSNRCNSSNNKFSSNRHNNNRLPHRIRRTPTSRPIPPIPNTTPQQQTIVTHFLVLSPHTQIINLIRAAVLADQEVEAEAGAAAVAAAIAKQRIIISKITGRNTTRRKLLTNIISRIHPYLTPMPPRPLPRSRRRRRRATILHRNLFLPRHRSCLPPSRNASRLWICP